MAQSWPFGVLETATSSFGEAMLDGIDGALRAGVVPTRDEIVAWTSQISVVDWARSAEAALASLPVSVRLVLALLLVATGALIIVRSYRRLSRPTQGALARRVALQARENGNSAETPDNSEASEPVSGTNTVRARDGEAKPVTARATPATGFPRPTGPKAFLTADQIKSGQEPWAVPLGHDLVRIGRHQENDIRLEDKTVHRYHALLHRSPDGDFLIRDLSGQAGNGVYVNGMRIEQAALRSGDLVELGAVRLRFQQQRPS